LRFGKTARDTSRLKWDQTGGERNERFRIGDQLALIRVSTQVEMNQDTARDGFACTSQRYIKRDQFLFIHSHSTKRQIRWQRELLQSYSNEKASELIGRFIRNQTWQVPTLILLKNDAFPMPCNSLARDPRRKYIPRQFLANWEKGARGRDKDATAAELELRRALLDKSIQIVGKMNSAGVRTMAGTDTTAPYVFPGSSLHEELALLVEASLTPMQAVQAATKNPAEFLGKLQTQGTIESGRFADLILLDADPLDDIHNTQKIRAVFLRGKFLDRNALDEIPVAFLLPPCEAIQGVQHPPWKTLRLQRREGPRRVLNDIMQDGGNPFILGLPTQHEPERMQDIRLATLVLLSGNFQLCRCHSSTFGWASIASSWQENTYS